MINLINLTNSRSYSMINEMYILLSRSIINYHIRYDNAETKFTMSSMPIVFL